MKKHSRNFIKIVQDAKKRIDEISVKEVQDKQKKRDKFFFVDVREESEWKDGHAKGAIHLAKGIIERDVEDKIPNKKSTVVLYCGGGFRSALAADNIQKMGYKKVYSMAGGWRAWKQSKGRIIKPK